MVSNKADLKLVSEFYKRGVALNDIAEYFGISRRTVIRYLYKTKVLKEVAHNDPKTGQHLCKNCKYECQSPEILAGHVRQCRKLR